MAENVIVKRLGQFMTGYALKKFSLLLLLLYIIIAKYKLLAAIYPFVLVSSLAQSDFMTGYVFQVDASADSVADINRLYI